MRIRFTVVWLAYPNVSQWTWSWLPLILYAWERGVGIADCAGGGAKRGAGPRGGYAGGASALPKPAEGVAQNEVAD